MTRPSLFLVSFSNQAAYSGRPVLGLVDVANGEFHLPSEVIDHDLVLSSSGGAGLCRIPTGYALILQGYPCHLCYLNHDLSLARVVRLKLVEDAHSIVWTGHSVLAVSTETNAIVEISPTDEETIIHYEGTPDSKSEHLNGIALDENGAIILSGFGDRRGCGQAPRDGYLKRISTGEILVGHLREPHSVQYYDGVLYTLESQTGNLVRSFDGRTISAFRKFFGYARGLAFNNDYTIVGQSAIRFGSRRDFRGGNVRGVVRASSGGLHIISPSGQSFLPLGEMADEVYDIIAFDGTIADLRRLPVLPARDFFEGAGGAKDLLGPRLNRSWKAQNAGRFDDAIGAVQEALTLRPQSMTAIVASASLQVQAKLWIDAEVTLRDALSIDPDHALVHSMLASAYIALGKEDQAAQLLRRAIEIAPRYKLLRHNLGLQYASLGRLEEAAAVFEDMLALDPEGDSTQRLYAGIMKRQAKFDKALPHALRAINLRSDVGEYYDFAANIYMELGNLSAAEAMAREGTRIAPDGENCHLTLLNVLLADKKEDDVVIAAAAARRQNPHSLDFHVQLGELVLDRVGGTKAVEWLEAASAAQPNYHRMYHALSRAYNKIGNRKKAVQAAREACRLAPDNPYNWTLLGRTLADAGEAAESSIALEKARELGS